MTPRSSQAVDAFDRPIKRASESVESLPLFGGVPETPPVTHEVPVRAHMRAIPGEAPPTGKELRAAALEAHEADEAKRTAVTYLRAQLAALYRTRCVTPAWRHDPYVTADDIEHLLRHWSACPAVLHEIPGHWKGSVFARNSWVQTGKSVPSVRPRMRATILPCWRLRSDAQQERAS
jgi:hypothetical protein